MIEKQEMLDFLYSMHRVYSNYHSQKENRAWAAVVLYAATMLAIARTFSDLTSQATFAFLIVIAFLVTATVIYIKFQLQAKRVASEYVAAATLLICEILDSDTPFDSSKYSPMLNKGSLARSKRSPFDADRFLPQFFLEKASEVRAQQQEPLGFGEESRLEVPSEFSTVGLVNFASYLIVLTTTVMAIVSVLMT